MLAVTGGRREDDEEEEEKAGEGRLVMMDLIFCPLVSPSLLVF